MTIEVGKTELAGLEGRYRIIDLLDEGPAGTVYLGLEREFSEQVAVKALPAAGDARGEVSRQFSREAKILQTLDSPYVPRVRDWGADQGLIFIVMEHTPGKTLARLLEEAPQGQLEDSRALDIARKIGLALETTFARKIVHRDLKPRNVIVTREGLVKLTNFGLAEHLDLERITQGDSRTLVYLAPEQSESGRPVDIRADIYAAGAVLYEMLAGRPPFEAANNVELVMKILTKDPPPLYRMRPDLPLAVHRLVEKALAKKPTERFQTPRELVAAIERIRLEDGPAAQTDPYEEALQAQAARDWKRVVQLCDAALAANPQHPAASGLRSYASQRLREETTEPEGAAPGGDLAPAVFVSASARQYRIPKARSLIGRFNRTTKESPDIDLGAEPDGDTVSRKHAWVVYDAGSSAWFLELHGAHKNVVKVNGQKMADAPVRLHDGDEIQMGAIRLTFRTH